MLICPRTEWNVKLSDIHFSFFATKTGRFPLNPYLKLFPYYYVLKMADLLSRVLTRKCYWYLPAGGGPAFRSISLISLATILCYGPNPEVAESSLCVHNLLLPLRVLIRGSSWEERTFALSHAAARTQAMLHEFGWEVFEHPTCSPVLAPSWRNIGWQTMKKWRVTSRSGQTGWRQRAVTGIQRLVWILVVTVWQNNWRSVIVTRGIYLYFCLSQTVFTFWMTLAIMYLHCFYCFAIRATAFRFIQFHLCFVRHRISVTTCGRHFVQAVCAISCILFAVYCG